LALDIDVGDLLPPDDASYGFDNMAGVLKMSQALMERYLAAANTISRKAIGSPLPALDSKIYRIASDTLQVDRADGLPFGTRGGLLIRHQFPEDGEYEIRIDLNDTEGLSETHRLEVSIDGEQVSRFDLGPSPPSGSPYFDANISKQKVRIAAKAGPRAIG